MLSTKSKSIVLAVLISLYSKLNIEKRRKKS